MADSSVGDATRRRSGRLRQASSMDIYLKVLEAKGIGAKGIPIQRYSKAKGIPIQRYSKAKGIWNNIFTSPKEP